MHLNPLAQTNSKANPTAKLTVLSIFSASLNCNNERPHFRDSALLPAGFTRLLQTNASLLRWFLLLIQSANTKQRKKKKHVAKKNVKVSL